MKERLTRLLSSLNTIPLDENEFCEIEKALISIIKDEKLLEITEHYFHKMFEQKEILGRELIEWENPYSDEKLGCGMLFSVIMFLRAFELMEKKEYVYGKDNTPVDFYAAYLRHFRINVSRSGGYGLVSAQKFWSYCYLKPIAFELGRLAFEILDYNYGYEVYQNHETGETYPIALADLRFDEKGKPDSEGSFVTTFSINADTVSGYTYDESGHLIFEKKTFNGGKKVLGAGDKAVAVHMPGNAKLTEDVVEESFENARVFLDRYFPDLNYKAFICSSWLLDTQLKNFVGENSNILKLQKRFRIALAFKNGFSLFDNVFGVPKCPIDELVPQNRFQSEILEMIKAGGSLYSGRGYILR